MFKKGQYVVAVDGRYDAYVERRHKNGEVTIQQFFQLEGGKRVGGFLGYRHRIDPALVRAERSVR